MTAMGVDGDAGDHEGDPVVGEEPCGAGSTDDREQTGKVVRTAGDHLGGGSAGSDGAGGRHGRAEPVTASKLGDERDLRGETHDDGEEVVPVARA